MGERLSGVKIASRVILVLKLQLTGIAFDPSAQCIISIGIKHTKFWYFQDALKVIKIYIISAKGSQIN